MELKPTSIRMNPNVNKTLTEFCNNNGLKKNFLINQLILNYLKQRNVKVK